MLSEGSLRGDLKAYIKRRSSGHLFGTTRLAQTFESVKRVLAAPTGKISLRFAASECVSKSIVCLCLSPVFAGCIRAGELILGEGARNELKEEILDMCWFCCSAYSGKSDGQFGSVFFSGQSPG